MQFSLAIVQGVRCVVCESPFEVTRRRGRPQLFCSDPCRKAQHKRQIAEWGKAHPQRSNVRPVIAKVCEVCEASFETVNLQTRCCGPDCGQVLGARIRAENMKARAPDLFLGALDVNR